MSMHCVEGVVLGYSSGTVGDNGRTVSRDLVRVRDQAGIERRVADVLITNSMDLYLSNALNARTVAKLFLAEHYDRENKKRNILFGIVSDGANYSDEAFWDEEKKFAVRHTRAVAVCGWILAAFMFACFCLHVYVGLFVSVFIVPILLIGKWQMSKVWARLNKLNDASEMREFIAQSGSSGDTHDSASSPAPAARSA